MTGTAMRHPNEYGIVGMLCDNSGVLEGAVLVASTSTNDAAALPAGASTSVPILGLAYKAGDPSTTGQRIEVVTEGVYPGLANVGITRGNKVVVASASGDLAPVGSGTVPGATIVGVALESCNAGERVAILIGAGAIASAFLPGVNSKVRCIATSNVNLASALAAGSTVDGVTLAAGDRVLLVAQTTASQNGVYVAPTSGAASYAADYAQGLVTAGQGFDVTEGTAWAASTWKATAANPYTIGTTDPLFYPRIVSGTQALSGGAATVSSLFVRATTSGLALVDQTAAAAVKGVLTAGRGTGSLALTGTSTDTILYSVTNF